MLIAGRLAKKGVQPTHLTLICIGIVSDRSCEALATFLSGEQHLPLFRHVTSLWLNIGLSQQLLQVREQTGV
jgi:hypothetical protein